MLPLLAAAVVLLAAAAPAAAVTASNSSSPNPSQYVILSNADPRRDVTGTIMDAHDSKITYKDGLFYWFAASYGGCQEPAGGNGCADFGMGTCGFRFDHNVTLYTSADLLSWTNQGVVYGAQTGGLPPSSILFAPKTVWNAKTQLWVLWFNYIVHTFDNSYYAVAVSPTPTGPFKLVVANVTTLQYPDTGDLNLFVDDDGTGYIIYTSISNDHGMSIERLTPDFLGSEGKAGSSGLFGARVVEAPMMFKRDSVYYAVFGSCCCYCETGNPAIVYAAAHPLGPYTAVSSLGDLHSQSTDIFSYPTVDGGLAYMYLGDHWQSAPDLIKGHDFTVWAPLLFDHGTVTTAGFQDYIAAPAPGTASPH